VTRLGPTHPNSPYTKVASAVLIVIYSGLTQPCGNAVRFCPTVRYCKYPHFIILYRYQEPRMISINLNVTQNGIAAYTQTMINQRATLHPTDDAPGSLLGSLPVTRPCISHQCYAKCCGQQSEETIGSEMSRRARRYGRWGSQSLSTHATQHGTVVRNLHVVAREDQRIGSLRNQRSR